MPTKPPPKYPDLLPIKLIMPRQGTERKVPGGGAPPKPFRPVDKKYRKGLSNQVHALRSVIAPEFKKAKIAPARVKLVSKAIAKSHRPEHLFS